MKVVVTTDAQADLSGIKAHIAQHNPSRAVSFTRELLRICRGIGRVPHGSPILTGREGDALRRRVFGAYLIVYRVDDDSIQIVRVLHGARDLERLLPSKP